MKTSNALIAGAALAAVLVTAQANFSPAKADDFEAPAVNWTGVYIGGQIGYGSGTSDIRGTVNEPANWTAPYTTFANANSDTSLSPGGFLGGGRAGGNYQFGHFVIGAEVSYDWLNADASRQTGLLTEPGAVGVAGSFFDEVEVEDLFTARGRLGIATGNALFYVTGGYASADVSRTQALLFANGNNFITSGSDRQDGWTWGGGFELAFCQNWSLTAEYLRVELDGDTLTSNSALLFPQSLTTTSDTDIDVVHVGLNYRFW
jgi:outer membrane immunogenic protein